MSTWTDLIFVTRQILTARTMNALMDDIKAVRTNHVASASPSSPTKGCLWLDDTDPEAWSFSLYTGDDWIEFLTFNSITLEASGSGGSGGGGGGTGSAGQNWGELQITDRASGIKHAGPWNGPRNSLINGGFRFWQRGTSFTSPATGDYTADRWRWRRLSSDTGEVTITKAASPPTECPGAPVLQIEVTTADTTISSNNFYGIEQICEGRKAAALGFGGTQGGRATLSGWFNATLPGNIAIVLQNGDATRCVAKNINLQGGGNWEFAYVTFDIDEEVAAWDELGDGAGLRVLVTMACGTDQQAEDGVWTHAATRGTTGSNNFMGLVGNRLALCNVQLEPGGYPTPYEHLDPAVELAICQRFYRKTFALDVAPSQNVGSLLGALWANGSNVGSLLADWRFPEDMVQIPEVTTYSPSATNAYWWNEDDSSSHGNVSTHARSKRNVVLTGNDNASSANDLCCIHVVADAELV